MRKIDIKELANIKKIMLSDSEFSRVFLANDKVYKLFYRNAIIDHYSELISTELTGDLVKKREQNIIDAYNLIEPREIVKPIELIYDNKGFLGYSMEYIEGTDFYDILYANLDSHNYLNLVCDNFYKIEQIVKKGHDLNIVFPDIFTKGNIVLDESQKHRIIDLDSLQINNNFLWQSSSVLGDMETGILKTTRFRTDTELKKEFDHFSILNSFLLCSTYINIATLPYNKTDELLLKVLWLTGLDKEARIVEELLNAYRIDGTNTYLGETYKRLATDYYLESNYQQPNSKKFVKKR